MLLGLFRGLFGDSVGPLVAAWLGALFIRSWSLLGTSWGARGVSVDTLGRALGALAAAVGHLEGL